MTLTQDELKTIKCAAFILETMAHLQGRERELLGVADRLRDIVARQQANAPRQALGEANRPRAVYQSPEGQIHYFEGE